MHCASNAGCNGAKNITGHFGLWGKSEREERAHFILNPFGVRMPRCQPPAFHAGLFILNPFGILESLRDSYELFNATTCAGRSVSLRPSPQCCYETPKASVTFTVVSAP